MQPWPEIPEDVIDWFRGVFSYANRKVCERLANLPNIRETSLDDGLIEALIPDTAPTLQPSGAIVRMDTHNIGGLRRLGDLPWEWERPFGPRWETADIAVLVFVYSRKKLIAKKIGLLQSKRLYPSNKDIEEEDAIEFLYGMNAFLRREDQQAVGVLHSNFMFDERCVYGAIQAGENQIELINKLNEDFGKAVYYLLYNPHVVPLSVEYPLSNKIAVSDVDVGCRVYDAEFVHGRLVGMNKGASPTFHELNNNSAQSSWPLETWAADLLLKCKVGEQFSDDRDGRVRYFLERRSGPIGAALAVSVTLPE